MAFLKRTWLARIGIGLNKFVIGNKDNEGKQTLTNAPDSVTQIGDVISAENLNDLEDRIESGFNEKQDVLTFDDVPTADSNNPVKSGGIYTAFLGKVSLSDFVIETVRWVGQWSTYSDGERKALNFDVMKSGYTPVGIVGYDVDLYKSDGYAKFAVTMVDLNISANVANVFIVFLENVTVSGAPSNASIDVLYVKNS